MSGRIWSLGAFLVALGVAAQVMGWDAVLWLPMLALDALAWIPRAVEDAIRNAPATTGIIALGVVLMIVARVVARRGG